MNKLNKVKKSLENKTEGTSNFITVTTNTDARHSGKYAIKNLATNNTTSKSYNTLKEIIEEFELTI